MRGSLYGVAAASGKGVATVFTGRCTRGGRGPVVNLSGVIVMVADFCGHGKRRSVLYTRVTGLTSHLDQGVGALCGGLGHD